MGYRFACCFLFLLFIGCEVKKRSENLAYLANEPSEIPVGLDAYRMWDRLPYLRIGARAYMRSTYDRMGGNHSADASHYLYQQAEDFNVTLDVKGQGVLYFARYNHWHGSPWHYEVDGVDHIVKETSTADPKKPVKDSVFIPEHLFPNPLTWTWSVTKGADLMWVPIPFERSFRMAYSRTHYGTGYYIYHQFVRGAKLSRPIVSWDGKTSPDKDVLELISRSGTDLVPRADTPQGKKMGIQERSGETRLPKEDSIVLAKITEAPCMLRALELSVAREDAIVFSRAMIRVTWDDQQSPSIYAPVALFFGTGTLYNRDGREYLVKGFPINVRFDEKRVNMACYFPMPFFRSAKIELIGTKKEIAGIRWGLRFMPYKGPANHVAYFHATYRDLPSPEAGKDLVLLDTRGIEGKKDWSGHFVGTSIIFSHRAFLNTLEGDPRFFFDDSLTPQAYGTGTEEWNGGGDYWGGQNMTLPFAGHPVGAKGPKEAKCPEDLIQSAYRFLIADLMPFGKNAVIGLEHGGENHSKEHYETVTYWYGIPSPSLILTDQLDVGNLENERSHDYVSPDASKPVEITSRYECGVETIAPYLSPFANPPNYAEMEFEADADKTYYIWLRGKGLNGSIFTDAVWIQFDDLIGTDQLGETYNNPVGFGNWREGYSANTFGWNSAHIKFPPQTVLFKKSGRHKLRIQPREVPHVIDQIWLSTTQSSRPDFKDPMKKDPKDRLEIVLDTENVTKIEGKFQIIDDKDSSIVKALKVDGRGPEVYPAHTEKGRFTKGTSEFTLKLEPGNLGVLMRRTLDYSLPNQCAEVYIADVGSGNHQWKHAGTWYLAGSNTCVYSFPPDELGSAQHIVQTSNRRFRDDEFLVPRDLTEGRSYIRVRIQFTPVKIPLFPGHPVPELAWSEIRYKAYCFVMPRPFDEKDCVRNCYVR